MFRIEKTLKGKSKKHRFSCTGKTYTFLSNSQSGLLELYACGSGNRRKARPQNGSENFVVNSCAIISAARTNRD